MDRDSSVVAATVTSSERSPSASWALPLGVAVTYLTLAQGPGLLSEWITGDVYQGPVFWPAAGIALGAMLITARSRWPSILAAVFVAEVSSNLLYGVTAPATLGWATANVLHPWVAATLIRRAHERFDLISPAQLAAFVLFAGFVGPACSALVGTTTSVLWWDGSWSAGWRWLVGDGLGALVIVPLFVAWRTRRVHRSALEVAIGGTALVVACLVAFRNWGGELDTVLPYLVLPPLVWASLRLGLRGASVAVAAVGMLGGWSTALGYGPFAASVAGATVLFQIYLAVLVVTALLIAVLVAGLTEREAIQFETQRRQRQQAALALLGQQVLVADRPQEVLGHLGRALDAIAEEPAGDPSVEARQPRLVGWLQPRSPDAVDADPDAGTPAPDGRPLHGLDPWAPLGRHRELLVAEAFVERHAVAPGSVALAATASGLAANALDRLDQEARLRDRADELEELNAQLARAGTFRDQLVSMVSHELRSPLTPIIGFVEVLRRTQPAGGEDREFALQAIERNAHRILALIDELLLSARAADGELSVASVPTDVATTVQQALRHGFDHVEVVVEGDDTIRATVDPGHLRQCVLNLVTNAIKYGAAPVTVRVRDDAPDHVAIEVSDRGAGVPEEVLPVLFERFTQANAPSADTSSGVGLGLSIVTTFVQANHGTVSYRPPDEHGPSTFQLRFPRAPSD